MKNLHTFIRATLILSLLVILSISTVIKAADAVVPGYITSATTGQYIRLINSSVATIENEDGLIKITAGLTGNYPISFEPKSLDTQVVVVREYPIAAMKIKLNNPDMSFGEFRFATDGSLAAKGAGAPIASFPMTLNTSYQKTTDWQLVSVDMSEFYDSTTEHGGVTYKWVDTNSKYAYQQYNLLPMNSTATADDIVYIEWIGYFKSLSEAQTYFDPTSGETTTAQEQTTATTTAAGTTAPATGAPVMLLAAAAPAVMASIVTIRQIRRRKTR